ncbi:hypothetical protein Golob_006601 [Gossypium lobatum]|uniref:Uncharacterized protein n=1 Tax=Gossypium lobatum TaxID=34289 RepID=A0A7J8MWX2_9ROSI|nr:hypothetical protein [Gossypium lobatum]
MSSRMKCCASLSFNTAT